MTAGLEHGGRQPRGRISKAPPPPVRLADDELDLLSFFRLLRRRAVLISVIVGVILALSLPLILTMERKFYAQSRLLIQRPMTASFATTTEASAMFDLSTEVERLTSQVNALRVIEAFNLKDNPEFNPGAARDAVIDDAATATTGDKIQDMVVQRYFRALTVRRNGLSSVIDIGFRSSDPKLAADVANAIVRIYLEKRDEQLRSQVSVASDWLEKRISEQRARMSDAEDAVTAFRLANGSNSVNLQEAGVQRLSALNAQLSNIQAESTALSATIAELEAAKGTPALLELEGSDVIPVLRRDLQLQQRDLARLLKTYGDGYASVVATRALIAETEAAILREVDQRVLTLKARAGKLDDEARAIKADLTAARDGLSRMSIAEDELGVLIRAVDSERDKLDALEQQRRGLITESMMPLAEAEVLSPATIPIGPDGHGRKVYLLGVLILAMAVGVTVACIVELLDRTVRSPHQLRGIPGVNPVGLVPTLTQRGKGRLPERIITQPDSAFSDSIRSLALSLGRTGFGTMPRSVLITSALPGEGKSTIAVALAVKLAASGDKVLLVDGDLRRGTIHSHFDVPAEPGLGNFLGGDYDLPQVIRHDADTGVHYVPRGNWSSANYPDFRWAMRVIQYARENDFLLIFDSAPVLAIAETSLLAGLCDRTLLLVRWGKTPRRMVDLAIDRLSSRCSEDVLVAINGVDTKRHALYGYGDAGLYAGDLRRYHADPL